ncbi:MAG TPA: Uma2 family endonuclease [Leptolyngbyaceae cyanobacterium]
MAVITSVLKPVSQIELAPGSVVTIPNVTWTEFESILDELGEKRSARIAYSKNTLEIKVPLAEHERSKDLISDIIKFLLKSAGRRFEPFGSTTFKREGAAGVEPDACFYIQNYQRTIGRRRLEPGDPPPDLAIETDVTSKTTFDAYEAIAVTELWIYSNGRLKIYLLVDGRYVESDISPNFPEIAIAQIIPQTVERAWQVGSYQALEEFEIAIGK